MIQPPPVPDTAPASRCPQCFAALPASALSCPSCHALVHAPRLKALVPYL